jgi:hypothetical protein
MQAGRKLTQSFAPPCGRQPRSWGNGPEVQGGLELGKCDSRLADGVEPDGKRAWTPSAEHVFNEASFTV